MKAVNSVSDEISSAYKQKAETPFMLAETRTKRT